MKTTHTQEDIQLEASLLKALSIEKNHKQFIHVLDTKRLIPITNLLLKDYKKYYEKYENDIDWGVFYTEFSQNWHKKDLDEDDLRYYRETVFPLVQNSIVLDSLFISLLERDASEKIKDISESGFDHKAINTVLEELDVLRSVYDNNKKDDEVFSLGAVDVSVLESSNGLPWFMPSLQAGLGSHMPGQFMVIAADSDVGKSAFCISQAVHVFKHLNKLKSAGPILYCTSEDTKEDLACRFLSCLYKDVVHNGFEDIITQYDKVLESYKKSFDDKLFVGVSVRGSGSLYTIKQKIAKYKPSLIIIDMLDKLSGSDNIQDLTKLYQEIRGISNDGFPIIGTSQTGNTSYEDKQTHETKHRKWLSDKDLAGSKSGKQGAAYCMIMIGKDDAVPGVRYVATTKKKRGKHCRITCEIIEKYSLYKELI